ncbi:PilZ domain-containing protein [Chitinispirillales bacterium ANBcel5]|uniref:PilZ domain-containing protein n=1 Tax=Cellulosispirillum alkaliphilum TaxID=3039283 RepID=UPI002A561BF7|nr:PilZ domain-containing protein [Chitinispirillales bacterium ANBcel5]
MSLKEKFNFSSFFYSGTEKRSTERAFLTVAVTIEFGDQIIRCAECRNISHSGMLIYLNEEIPLGAQGTVTLTKKCAKRRYSFSADFEVVRKEKHKIHGKGIGIKFRHLYEEDELALRHIVEYHLALMFRSKLDISEEKLSGIEFKIAQTKDELEQAFKIVHDTYVMEKFIEPQAHGMRLTLYHSLPFTTTFIGKNKDEVVVACTLFLESVLGLPMDKIFHKELKILRNNRRLIAELGSFAVKPGWKSSSVNLAIHLHKLITQYTIKYFNLDDIVITINPKHKTYYQHVWLFEPIGREKVYKAINGNPAIAMYYNLRTAEQRMKESYENSPENCNIYDFIFKKKSSCLQWPDNHAPIIVWNKDLLHYFFEEKTSIFADSNKDDVMEVLKLYS